MSSSGLLEFWVPDRIRFSTDSGIPYGSTSAVQYLKLTSTIQLLLAGGLTGAPLAARPS